MKLLFENFDKIIDAPNGIEKARQMILQLAVHGKLVEQDPNDEPASELLKRIKQEKEKLIAERKIKKQKEFPLINRNDELFKLPSKWSWIRLNEVFNFIDYRGKTPDKISDGIRLITAKNVRMGHINLQPEEFISQTEYSRWMTRGFPRIGDLLFTTEAPLGNIAQINISEKIALAQRVINFQAYLEFDTKFLMIALLSSTMQKAIWEKATGMTAKGIKAARLKMIPIMFPPIAEQKRIVEKVNKLLSILDKLEEKRNRCNKKRVMLNNSSLDKLIKSKDSKEFKLNWNRITNNFDTLYSVPENVDKLKQTILQLAVQGKLTEEWRKNNPNVEPASQLLKKIKKEKEKLIAEGKIKKQKELPPIKDEENPFELPDGWGLVKLGNVIDLISGQHIRNIDYNNTGKGFPYITGPADFGKLNPIITKWTESPKVFANKDDILVTVKGAGLGKLNVVNLPRIVISRQLMAIRPFYISNDYLYRFLETKFREFQASGVGIAIPGLSRDHVNKLVFPFASLEEQKQIVKKVNELMAFCNKLEEKIKLQTGEQERLVRSVISKV